MKTKWKWTQANERTKERKNELENGSQNGNENNMKNQDLNGRCLSVAVRSDGNWLDKVKIINVFLVLCWMIEWDWRPLIKRWCVRLPNKQAWMGPMQNRMGPCWAELMQTGPTHIHARIHTHPHTHIHTYTYTPRNANRSFVMQDQPIVMPSWIWLEWLCYEPKMFLVFEFSRNGNVTITSNSQLLKPKNWTTADIVIVCNRWKLVCSFVVRITRMGNGSWNVLA